MYTLYYKESEPAIKVSKAHKGMQRANYTDEVTRHNDCYFTCTKRKPLVDKALELQLQWIANAEKELQVLKDIKI